MSFIRSRKFPSNPESFVFVFVFIMVSIEFICLLFVYSFLFLSCYVFCGFGIRVMLTS